MNPQWTEPEVIGFIGDVQAPHQRVRDAIRAVVADGAEVVVQLGDLGFNGDASGQILGVIDQTLSEAGDGVRMLFVDGNHENFDALYRIPVGAHGLRRLSARVWHVPRGYRWTWHGVRFMALGGAHSVDRQSRRVGVSWWPQERLTTEEVANAIRGGPVDVMLTHDCPAGVVIPGVDDRHGPPPFPPEEILTANTNREVLRRVVDAVRPRVIVHAHYDVRYNRMVNFGYGGVLVEGLDGEHGPLRHTVWTTTIDELREVVTA